MEYTLSSKVSLETVEGKLFRGISTNVVIPPVETQGRSNGQDASQ